MVDWTNLLREIETGNCAIVLGHSMLSTKKGISEYMSICQQLADTESSKIHAYYPQEHFFLFKSPRYRRGFAFRMEEHFKGLKPDMGLYQKLAEIPVPLYISISPDTFLQAALGSENCTAAHFDHSSPVKKDYEATPEKPLVYQLFGSVENPGSLILSHDNLFDFFRGILGEKGLPTAIKKFFREDAGGEVIFLGFDFRRWYVQLLLRLFNLNKSENELNRTAYSLAQETEEHIALALQHFNVEFIDEHSVIEFIEALHERCADKGLLRQFRNTREEASQLLEEDRLQRLEELKGKMKELNKLRLEWEEKEMFAENPTERMRCEKELEKLRGQALALKKEIKALTA